MEITPFFKRPRPTLAQIFTPATIPALAVYCLTLVLTQAFPDLITFLWSLPAVLTIVYLSPPLRFRDIGWSFFVSSMAVSFGLFASWSGARTFHGQKTMLWDQRTSLCLLQEKLELLCRVGPVFTILAVWAFLWTLTSMRARWSGIEAQESRRRRATRGGLLVLVLTFVGVQLWLFNQPGIGPIYCPAELQLRNLPKVKHVTFGDPRIASLTRAGELVEELDFVSMQVAERDHFYGVVAQALNQPNYQPTANELYTIFAMTTALDRIQPPTDATVEYSAALLAFARRHKREFFWGSELRYFWRHGLPYLAAKEFSETDVITWKNYRTQLKLDDSTEICAVRYFTEWTCSESSMRLFGIRFGTSVEHLLRDSRIRRSCLVMGTRRLDEEIRREDPEANALGALLEAKEVGRFGSGPTMLSWYDSEDGELDLFPPGPAIFRSRLVVKIGDEGAVAKKSATAEELPETLCRCDKRPPVEGRSHPSQ